MRCGALDDCGVDSYKPGRSGQRLVRPAPTDRQENEMTSTAAHPPLAKPPARRRANAPASRARRSCAEARTRRTASQSGAIARYVDCDGRTREIVTRVGREQSVLVLDRDVQTRGDARLIAHLAADEPPGNAALASRSYIARARRGSLCRALCEADLTALPFPELNAGDSAAPHDVDEPRPDSLGRRYELARVSTGMSIPELRWRRHCHDGAEPVTVSVREAIACQQSYEPVRALTLSALSLHENDDAVSVTALRGELQRVQQSPIVLNRGLRETVLAAMAEQGLSMSEIAIRCGRIKRDSAGNQSGETSWLARRLGLLAEGGRSAPTPWVHSDVLALIARDGLGVAPREVELN
jgi:hypothetical protein